MIFYRKELTEEEIEAVAEKDNDPKFTLVINLKDVKSTKRLIRL